ncbi:hypothetical protein FC40_GL001060 [Ligilactobacillus hayakitensis DSM 18933 = JCM 14209]|uniref:Uncharacterized protein n=1 Tax=Ligilactobacillus hayakitensis DSM 18933 = JCM 14209 TaxID=1423755 RepID=A0A0R1WKT3_9LACO|nr:hypothetical protein FC40_GL001060 [Ligilactobacillus hayakitensis DSM 18933 = JCM 14209]
MLNEIESEVFAEFDNEPAKLLESVNEALVDSLIDLSVEFAIDLDVAKLFDTASDNDLYSEFDTVYSDTRLCTSLDLSELTNLDKLSSDLLADVEALVETDVEPVLDVRALLESDSSKYLDKLSELLFET